MANDSVSKSWFCIFDNPAKHGFEGEPAEIIEKIVDTWIAENPQRTCAVVYCISAKGLHHCHAVFEDTKAMRFSAVKKMFPSMHIEATKGNKRQAENYINKRPPYDEKGEVIVCTSRHGEIKGHQGQRHDLSIIEEFINMGKTPDEIMDISLSYRRHEKIIRDAYFRKRFKETPIMREVTVFWHVGQSGSGKSFEMVKLAEIHGEDGIYKVSEYERGFIDKYSGQKILFMDELRGKIPYTMLLLLLGRFKEQFHARFTNAYGFWSEVHITSVFPPEKMYHDMVYDNREIDTYEELRRRISFMVYHYKVGSEYLSFQIPMDEYINYEDLQSRALEGGQAST